MELTPLLEKVLVAVSYPDYGSWLKQLVKNSRGEKGLHEVAYTLTRGRSANLVGVFKAISPRQGEIQKERIAKKKKKKKKEKEPITADQHLSW